MNVLFHNSAGPDLAARLAAVPGLRITACPEDDDALLARLLPETDVLWHVLKRCTAEMIAASDGLAYRIAIMRRHMGMDVILPYVLWVAFLLYLIDLSLRVLNRRMHPWFQS